MREPPETAEGWFALHDFRTVDWDRWREATERTRERALEEGVDHLAAHEALSDAGDGDSAVFTVLGNDADLLVLHFRPTLDDLDRAQRRFERTEFAAFTDRSDSYVSVTEVSGYVSDDYFGDGEVSEGLRRYIEGKLHPEVPADEYVSFYPMSKRRHPDANWYDLEFEERADLMAGHGEVAREFGGKVSQVISSSVGFDEFEWGVTLFGADPTDLKDIVYELRFDEATSHYAEFGDFYVGRRFPPADLPAFMAGESVPTGGDGDAATGADAHGGRHTDHAHGDAEHAHGDGATDSGGAHSHAHAHGEAESDSGATDAEGEEGADDADAVREALADLDIYAGQPHGEDVYAMVLYSAADTEALFEEVDGLRANFDHYDTHVKTAVYEGSRTDSTAVVSIWETASAAETAGGFLADLPEVVGRADERAGFNTLGMFYTVQPEYTAEFHETFGEVRDLLGDMDGHRETDLLVNFEDDADMFIASQWDAREDAMAFFRSEAFSETVSWGREVLADRPRHVFLA